MLSTLRKGLAPAPQPTPPPQDTGASVLDYYVNTAPTKQLAIDLFKGQWSTKFPASVGVEAGSVPLFEDSRITWLNQQSPLNGRSVLELGPLEGGHTAMLEGFGAHTTAVESNGSAYMKCLITKEIMNLRARFLLGDANEYLRATGERFDVCVASGILYHQKNPLDLLNLVSKVSDTLFLWTHYYDPETMVRSELFGEPRQASEGPLSATYHPRRYAEALEWKGFCGGNALDASWLSREDILKALDTLGFNDIRISHDAPNHKHGPSFAVLAMR